jgi:hypothetical protein
MLVRKSTKMLMGVFQDFSVCLLNKNININKTTSEKKEIKKEMATSSHMQDLIVHGKE